MKKRDQTYIDLESISQLHAMVGFPPPRHPLISVITHTDFLSLRPLEDALYRFSFYTISCKRFEGLMHYGKSHYDFTEGSLLFTAPGQVIGTGPEIKADSGWVMFVHPDLLYGTSLGMKIHQYTFFHYEVNEALHVSEEESKILQDGIDKIEREYRQPIDKHTRHVIVSNLELLLSYCDRFYDRQFFTRARQNADVVQRFEALLKQYFDQPALIGEGLPPVAYFASKLNLSPNYLSDLLQKATGKSTMEQIHLELVERAKHLLWSTENSISEIAYQLGFEHPSHFTKLFKSKTGRPPSEFRSLN